jgi:hypothetical protein
MSRAVQGVWRVNLDHYCEVGRKFLMRFMTIILKRLASGPVQWVLAALMLMALSAGASQAAEDAKPCPVNCPKPGPEHVWLQQFVGNWDADVQMHMDPTGKPPAKIKGTESIRPVGGFWIVSESKSQMMDMPFAGVQTLGYDANKQKFVGSWVDSMSSAMWLSEGTLDASGKVLTLESEGVCPYGEPGKLMKVRDVIELQDKNHKVFKSFMLGDDGQWIPTMTIQYQRKK